MSPLYVPNPAPSYVCTSATRPGSPYEGQMIYETDTDLIRVWNGASWKPVGGNVPAFRIYRTSDQALGTDTIDKVQFDAKTLDTGNYYSTSTYRYTPLVEGWYFIEFYFFIDGTADQQRTVAYIYKNGGQVSGSWRQAAGTGENGLAVSELISMDGSTDYLEFYVRSGTAGKNLEGTSAHSHAFGYWVRPV